MDFRRFFRHLITTNASIHKFFPKESMDRITQEIKKSENLHNGEIVFAIEASLHPLLALKGYSGRQRAVDIFSNLRIWDTEENNGVLIYLLLADHDIEILADRGIHKLVNQEFWEDICRGMEEYFQKKQFLEGVLYGIHSITNLLIQHFPKTQGNPNELPDRPVIIS